MWKFNKSRFIFSTFLFILLLIPSFIAAFAEDEGTLQTNSLWVLFAQLFYILRFPTHTLFWSTVINGGAHFYFGGLIINCIFYGLVTERIITFIQNLK